MSSVTKIGFSHPCRWGARLLLQLAKSLGVCWALRLIKKKKLVRGTARLWQGSYCCWVLGWRERQWAEPSRRHESWGGAEGGGRETREGGQSETRRRLEPEMAPDLNAEWEPWFWGRALSRQEVWKSVPRLFTLMPSLEGCGYEVWGARTLGGAHIQSREYDGDTRQVNSRCYFNSCSRRIYLEHIMCKASPPQPGCN